MLGLLVRWVLYGFIVVWVHNVWWGLGTYVAILARILRFLGAFRVMDAWLVWFLGSGVLCLGGLLG